MQKLYVKDRLKLLPFVPLRIKELQPLAVEMDTLFFNVSAMVHKVLCTYFGAENKCKNY